MRETGLIQIDTLHPQDTEELEEIEGLTNLCYWGTEHYKRFLQQPEYFGRKAIAGIGSDGNRMVGFFFARAVLENLELLKIGVYPDFQGRGVGTLLLQAAFVEGLRRGCLRCFLEVRKSNEGAMRFYFGHEFRIAGERTNYYTNPLEDAWIMERYL
ncbi:MAG: ribosomal-protein-alanine acetyltransferase [Acidobacteria bacterium]|nr:ribosomal-protein-alanine acetyltransferase [Acidobacteriota bacterium]